VNRTCLRLSLATLLAAGCACLLSAAEPAAPKETPKPAAAPETVGPVITLPVLQVGESRLRELNKAITKLDKQIAREKKKVKSSDLDKTLNNSKLASAAAIFGGNSSEHLSAVAATRVALMESERLVLEGMKFPRSEKELEQMETELNQLRTNRRNLDNAQAQR